MAARYHFRFVAVQQDGDIFDPGMPKDSQPTLDDLGKNGWHIVGLMPGSAFNGFSHTLIMQQRVITEWDDYIGEYVESEPL